MNEIKISKEKEQKMEEFGKLVEAAFAAADKTIYPVIVVAWFDYTTKEYIDRFKERVTSMEPNAESMDVIDITKLPEAAMVEEQFPAIAPFTLETFWKIVGIEPVDVATEEDVPKELNAVIDHINQTKMDLPLANFVGETLFDARKQMHHAFKAMGRISMLKAMLQGRKPLPIGIC